jgi:transcriptional regulator with XRE-family HTH domain
MERHFQINWPLLVEEAVRRRHGLKLTQRQLALLANVSTPTVSRFEQAAKDIQLSSALAIFEVLGMIDKRTLGFDENEQASRDLDDSIVFWGNDGETRVRCRIVRTALDDHFSDRDQLRPYAAFEKYRRDIEGLARRKYLLGQLEPDGTTVIIRTDDIA